MQKFLTKEKAFVFFKALSLITIAMAVVAFFFGGEESIVNTLLNITVVLGIIRMILVIGTKKDVSVERQLIHKRMLAGGMAVAGSITLLYLMLTSEEGSILYYFNSVNKANLKDYLIVLVLTIVLYIVIAVILEKVNTSVLHVKTELFSEFTFVLGVILLGLMRNQVTTSEKYPNYLWFIFTIGAVLLLLEGCKLRVNIKSLVYMSYVLAIVVWVLSTMVFNIYVTAKYGSGIATYNVHHAGAYLNPLYEIANGLPFAGGGVDLYGHYALFFLLPMKLFGSSSRVIGIIMGILGGLTSFFAIGTVHKLVKNDFVRMIGAFAILIAAAPQAIYWQVYPSRLLFSTIVMFYAACCKDKILKGKDYMIGYILCMLAILWNTESGIVCGLAWAVYIVLRRIQDQDRCFIQAVRVAIVQIIIVVAEAIVAFSIVKTYNFIASGWNVSYLLESKGELGVLSETSYMIDFHQTLLTWSNSRWLYILIAFLGVLLWSLARTGIVGKAKDDGTSATIGMIAIIGLGLFAFFFNRVAAGTGIINLTWCVLLPIVFEKVKDADLKCLVSLKTYKSDLYDGVKTLLKVIGIFYFTGVLLNVDTKFDTLLAYRVNNGSYDYQAYEAALVEFERVIPKDTYARGDGLRTIYMNLGWDMQLEEENAEYMVLRKTEDKSLVPIQTLSFADVTYTLYYNPNYQN